MSCFNNASFVKEFAARTKLNFYNNQISAGYDTDGKYKNLKNKLLREMSVKGFVVSEHYEVTALLNSLVGLLIFPEQKNYTKIMTNEKCKNKLRKLMSYINSNDKNKYFNSYVNEKESESLKNTIRHMRNAISHNKVKILPESGNGKQITHVCFEDSLIKKNESFTITIDINDLEDIVIEICDYILSLG